MLVRTSDDDDDKEIGLDVVAALCASMFLRATYYACACINIYMCVCESAFVERAPLLDFSVLPSSKARVYTIKRRRKEGNEDILNARFEDTPWGFREKRYVF